MQQLPPLDAKSKLPKSRGTINKLLQDHSHFTSRGPDFEEFDASLLQQEKTYANAQEPLLLAFYLPQFHPIRRSRMAWGKGFTGVAADAAGCRDIPATTSPGFLRDLGFYDLMESRMR